MSLLKKILLSTLLLSLTPTNAQAITTTRIEVPVSKLDNDQVRCIARNIYFEAGNQPTRGKIAVANVVMNRVADSRFPKTPCGVVNQRTGRTCQFSWVCSPRRIRDANLYAQTLQIARDVYTNVIGDVTNGAKYFHATRVRPSWARTSRATLRIGGHVFYH